jgi:membrane-bound lytic murein transglycosylase D
MERYLFRRFFLAGLMTLICLNIMPTTNPNDLGKKTEIKTENNDAGEIPADKDSFLIGDKEDASQDIANLSLEEAYLYQDESAAKIRSEKTDDLFYQDVLNGLIDKATLNLIAGPSNELISSANFKSNIPIFINEFVEAQYKYFLGRKNSMLSVALKRAEPYIGEMKQIFKDNNLPEDLAYLPLIESAYYTKAISRKGAVGMWQFMPYTARLIGMKSNEYFDERCDPLISCKFAAKFLSMLYDRFGDWYLALAAYNHGGFNVLKDIKRAGSSNFYDLVKKKIPPYETRTYVPRFVASLVILKNLDKYGVEFNEQKVDYEYFVLPFMTPAHLAAKYSNLSPQDFLKYNPALYEGFIPDPKYGYNIRLPKENMDALKSNLDLLKKDSSIVYVPYYVRSGDTLSQVAQRYGIALNYLLSVNNLNSKGILSIGQKLFLPLRGYQVSK